jgi:N,N-dimethylformamidase
LSSKPLLGYTDPFCVEAGQPIQFKVSSELPGEYQAEIVRLRCADHIGIGLKQSTVTTPVNGAYTGRFQPTQAGSYVEVETAGPFNLLERVTLQVYVWPTTPLQGRQALLGAWDETHGRGYAMILDEQGALAMIVGDGERQEVISTGVPVLERHWYLVAASYDTRTGDVWVGQRPLTRYARDDTAAASGAASMIKPGHGGTFRMAAWTEQPDTTGRLTAGGCFNGKLEAPLVAHRELTADEREAICTQAVPAAFGDSLIAQWDFSRDMSSTRIVDISPHGRHGETVNLPARAMKGHHWDGSEYNWTHKPEHYGAIHFHDDDLYDCGWETDFRWSVPEDLPSGLYGAYLTQDGHEDYVPFVVRPPRGTARAPLALLLPTAS